MPCTVLLDDEPLPAVPHRSDTTVIGRRAANGGAVSRDGIARVQAILMMTFACRLAPPKALGRPGQIDLQRDLRPRLLLQQVGAESSAA